MWLSAIPRIVRSSEFMLPVIYSLLLRSLSRDPWNDILLDNYVVARTADYDASGVKLKI
jgi:hypothetical protein